ncbi:Myosin-binding protein 7 [Linum perenne]
MDSAPFALPSRDVGRCCSCECSNCSTGSPSWIRTVKRKYDEAEGKPFVIPGLDIGSNPRVLIENELAALRETVASQQQAIQDLYAELEEERNAASSAANEAMSMILRLQREKAEVQMEARQFKRFAEEKMAHDQEELVALDDVLYKREQVIQSLSCEVQAYKHRMMSYGLTEAEAEDGFNQNGSHFSDNLGSQFDFPVYDYPQLKCHPNENQAASVGADEVVDVEKYAFGETPCYGVVVPRHGETPRGRDHLKNLEYRIEQIRLDVDASSGKHVLEKVVVGQSPRKTGHRSIGSSGSLKGASRDIAPESPSYKYPNSFKKADYVTHPGELKYTGKADNTSELEDDMDDRVYTIDAVHNGSTDHKSSGDDYFSSTRTEMFDQPDLSDPDIKKLYTRLHALEADRESMRQAIISMRTDKAQLVLLKEIAQQLCKDMTPERRIPMKKPSIVGSFKFISVFKWVTSFVFWRKKARQTRFGAGADSDGLLMLLDKNARARQQRRFLSRTHL